MVAKMGWQFGWVALHDLMDRSVDEPEVQAIRQTLNETPGVHSVHDVRTRKMGDMIVRTHCQRTVTAADTGDR